MARRLAFCVLALSVILLAASDAQLTGQVIARGLRNPVAVVADPTDRSVLLVVEQGGLVRVVRDGTVFEQPFLDVSGEVSTGGERGLLGLALAPDYSVSRRFFINFTNRNGDTVVARFTRDAENAVIADRASRFDLQWPDGRRVIDQPFSNHNGGHLAFGPDDYLYVGMGDGGSGGDPMNHAQNPQSLLGKMLRLDVNVPDDNPRGYRIPEDNPFVDGQPIVALPEIWAFGLRNPWRYSFDDWTRGGTSALTIGDVGQDAREEINFEPRPATPITHARNYGWRLREGRRVYEPRTTAAFEPLVEPIHDYGRSIGASVTGGLIYRGTSLDPWFNGRYFFADFVAGRVFSLGLHLQPDTNEATADDEQEHTERLGGRSTLGLISSFGADHDGELLIVNYSAGMVVRATPDFAVVPMAPLLQTSTEDTRVELAWDAASQGATAVGFFIERVRDGAVVERLFLERTSATLDWSDGDCLRVRALGRNGSSGPPSAPICAR